MFKKRAEMEARTVENCHDGTGTLECTHVLKKGDSEAGIRFMHDDLLAPGATIGEHTHAEGEEIYFVVEGHGTMIMDGEQIPMGPGDISMVKPGHSHGIINADDNTMRLIVLEVSP